MITIMDVPNTWLAFTVIKLGSYSESQRGKQHIIYPEIGRPENDSLHWKKKNGKKTLHNDRKYAFL